MSAKYFSTLVFTSSAPAEDDDGSADGKAERSYQVEVGGKLFEVKVIGEAAPAAATGGAALRKPPRRERSGGGGGGASGDDLVSPLQGNVFKVPVEEGQEVSEGDLICVIEAMKMENEITAHVAGKVTELNVSEGAAINSGDPIAKIE